MYTTNGPTVKNISEQLTKAVTRREAEKSLSVKKKKKFSAES